MLCDSIINFARLSSTVTSNSRAKCITITLLSHAPWGISYMLKVNDNGEVPNPEGPQIHRTLLVLLWTLSST